MVVLQFNSTLPPSGVKASDRHSLPQDVYIKFRAHTQNLLGDLPMLLCQRHALCSSISIK